MIEKSKKTQFDLFDIFILVAFSYRSIMVFFSAVFSRIPVIDVIGYQIVPLFVVAFAIICFMKGYFNGVKAKDFLFVLLILTVLLFSYLFHPENQPYYTQSNLQKIFVEAIPFFLLGLSFRCDKKTLKNLTIVSYIAIVLNSVYMFFYVGASATEGAYYMGQAYMLLPHVMFAINSVFDSSLIKSKFLSIVFTLFGFFFLTAMGTRGPLLIAAVYLMVKLVLTLDRKKTSQFYIIVGVICVVAWLIISGKYINILLWISDKISSLGMSTRAIDMLISNDYISHTSGRDSIFEMLWKKILERPFLGYGIFSEGQFNVITHNIALEFLLHYGIPLGILIIAAYIISALKAYFRSDNKYMKDLILLFFVLTVVHAPFGGSYWSYYFFFLLGLSILELRTSNFRKRQIIGKQEEIV